MLTPIRRVKRRDPIQAEPTTPSKKIKLGNEVGMLTPPPSHSKLKPTTGYSTARALFERGSRTRTFIGREPELKYIEKFIASSIKKRAGALYISGVPGTGKSAMVGKVLDKYGDAGSAAPAPDSTSGIKVAKINCMAVDAADLIYSAILAAYEYPSHVSSKQKAIEYLGGRLSREKTRHVLMLDEIDHFMRGDQEVLFQLFEWSCKSDSNLILIGIANTLDITDQFLPRLEAHHMVPQVLAVKPYTKDDILRVLKGQLEGMPTVFTSEALELFSAKVATQTGDLRRAFDLCARSLQHAEQDWLTSGMSGEMPPVSMEHALMVCQESFGGESVISRIRNLNYIQQCVLVTLLIMEHKVRSDPYKKAYNSIDVAQKYAMHAASEPSWTLLDMHEVLQVLTALESMSLVTVTGVCGKRGLGKASKTGSRPSRGGGGASGVYQDNSQLLSSRRIQSKIQMMDAFTAFNHQVLKRILCENL